MPRLVLALAIVAALTASAWSRTETPPPGVRGLAPFCALAFVPALLVALAAARRLRDRLLVGVLGILASATVAASLAFSVRLTEARPGSAHDFFGPVLGRFREGFLDFYETQLPFNRIDYPLMHGVVLFAVFGFVALAGVLLAVRRPVAGVAAALVGAGWPATLIAPQRPLLQGALLLAGLLTVLFLVRREDGPVRAVLQGAVALLLLVAVALAGSTSSAVAKDAFLDWQGWDFYDRPDEPVSVRYVWNSDYSGIHFPKKRTVVLKIKVEGPKRPLYWRATVLDEYNGSGWQENVHLGPEQHVEDLKSELADPLLPPDARRSKDWVRQDVEVGAFTDNHLVASTQPVRWMSGTSTPVREGRGGIVEIDGNLHPGQRYTAWSYVADAKPSQLARVGGVYPTAVGPDLELLPLVQLPSFASPARDQYMRDLFDAAGGDVRVAPYEALYRKARNVVGNAKSPYAAATLLEAWFRDGKQFAYTEHPVEPLSFDPPLVDFVLQTHRGYCQHYAGAMALMLRLLGIPARVAAGFTSGTWDAKSHEWEVTDHEAHTWVEVYFPGYGWLPFDPTPGRGQLSGSYTVSSASFDKDVFTRAVGVIGGEAARTVNQEVRKEQLGPGGGSRAHPHGDVGSRVGKIREGGKSLFGLLLVVLAVAVSALALVKLARRRLRFVGHDPRRLATACRRELVGFLADQGMDPPASATVSELGDFVERHFVLDATPFVRALTSARYGRVDGAAAAVRRARRELRSLERQMRSQLGMPRRVRGLVSLRSLAV